MSLSRPINVNGNVRKQFITYRTNGVVKTNGVLVTVNYPRLLLVSDSLAKNFVNDHVEVLAVPGGRVATLYDVLDVVPRNRTYEGVIIFIGGNSYGQWRGAPVLTPEFVISFFCFRRTNNYSIIDI